MNTLNVHELNKDQIGYHEYWYLPVIRELVTVYPFDHDFKKLGHRLDPPIKEKEAKEAVEILLKLGLIKKAQSGYAQVSDIVSSPDNGHPSQYAVHKARRFQKQHIDLAKRAIDVISPEERNISCATFAVNKKISDKIKKEIINFRKRISKIACKSRKPDRVYQFNLQFFPETKIPDKIEIKGNVNSFL